VRSRCGTQRELAGRARLLVAAHPGGRWPLVEIARRLGCSVFHLSRTFRRVHGRTLTAYRAEIRLQFAVARLRDQPDADLTDLALDCGYSSHSHFTASFRKSLGLTPSAFAASLLSGGQTRASAAPCDRCSR
jgi:AraC-like DNA-binding protein